MDLFNMKPAIRYTTEEAIADGCLVYPFHDKFPNCLLSASVAGACEASKGQTFEQAAIPLLMDCVSAVQARSDQEAEWPIKLSATVAGDVWIMPNDFGGITVMQPTDY